MKPTFRLALASLLTLVAGPALAAPQQTAPAPFKVTATVAATCSIRNQADLSFGTYDPTSGTDLTGTTTFDFRCSKGTAYQISIDDGSNFGLGIAGDRAMKGANGTEYLSYLLYSDAAHTKAWGHTLGTDTVDTTSTTANWSTGVKIYGVVPNTQDVSNQAYTDATVNIVVNY